MKRVFAIIALLLAFASAGIAQIPQPTCRIQATATNQYGPDAKFTVTIFKILIDGSPYEHARTVYHANQNGVLLDTDGQPGVVVPQGSTVWLYAPRLGFNEDPNQGTAYAIPMVSSVDLFTLAKLPSVLRRIGDTVYYGASGLAALPGNISTTPKIYTQVGNGTVSAAPAWWTLAAGANVTIGVNQSTKTFTINSTGGGGSGGTTLTTREVDGTPSVTTTILEFNQANGLTLSDQTGGVARVDLSGVPYTALNLANSVKNSDISSSASISLSKLAALTANRATATDGTGAIVATSVTDTEVGYLSGVTSAVQTQINGKAASSHTHAESDVTNLVTDLAAKVPTTRTITAGSGLTGGGDLTANRTLGIANGGVTNAMLATGIDAANIADGSVSNAEFQRLDGVTSAIQTQINGKAPTSRSISAGTGLSGGGDLSADRTFSLDINGLTAETVIASGDYVPIYDVSASALRKMTRADFVAGLSGGGVSIGGAVTGGTAGSIPFIGSGPVLAQDNSNLFWDASNIRLGIKTNSPTAGINYNASVGQSTDNAYLYVGPPEASFNAAQIDAFKFSAAQITTKNATSTDGVIAAAAFTNVNSVADQYNWGTYISVWGDQTSGTDHQLRGAQISANHNTNGGTQDANEVTGVYAYANLKGGGNIPDAWGGYIEATVNKSSGTVGGVTALQLAVTRTSGTVSEAYGLYISDVATDAAGSGFIRAIYTSGNAPSEFGGQVIANSFSGNGANVTSLNASNLSTGTVPSARGGAGTVNGLMKANGSGVVSAATAGTDYEVPLTFGTGLTRSTNTVTVNSSQSISKLSNLTTNGFVKTSGSDGTLSIDTNTYLTGNQTITLSGDVSGSGATSITTTIGSNKVTNGMLAQVATATFKGRTTSGTGNVEDLSATQATALLNAMVGDSGSGGTKGLVPAPASGDAAGGKFLKADGTWAVPAGGGGGSGTVNSGAANAFAFYPSAGTTVDDASLITYDTGRNPTIEMVTNGSTAFHIRENTATTDPEIMGFEALMSLHVKNANAYYALGYVNDDSGAAWANYVNSDGSLQFDSSGGSTLYIYPDGALGVGGSGSGVALGFYTNSSVYGQVFERSADHFALGTGFANFNVPNYPSLTWGNFGVILGTPNSLVADADLANSETHVALDESGNNLKFKAKYSSGGVHTFSLPESMIVSLGGQTGATQTFSKTDDTNVTLAINSSSNNHSFTLGWTGTLASSRGGAGTVNGLMKANGSGTVSAATSGTDYVAPGAATSSGLTMATSRLLGRTTPSSGAIEEISAGTGLSLSSGSLTVNQGFSPTWTAAHTFTNTISLTSTTAANNLIRQGAALNLGTTSTDGIILQNTTAAANNAQQISPRVRFTGQGWKTNSTAASQTVDFAVEAVPVQGTANPSVNLSFKSQINGGGYSEVASLTSGGTFTATAFSGDGSALSALNGSNVTTGTVSDSRLSSNIPLINASSQTFTGTGRFGSGGSNTILNGTYPWQVNTASSGEIHVIGNGSDLYLQNLSAPSNWLLECYGCTGNMIIGSGGNNNPVTFQVNRGEVARFQNGSVLNLGNTTASSSPVSGSITATGGSGTNVAGGNLTFSAGKGTGSAVGGSLFLQTSIVGSSGSTANSLVDRYIVNGARKTLTDASTNLFEVALPTLKGAMGEISFEIYASDGTNVQVRRGVVQYSAVNKAGTYTSEIVVLNEAASVSSGTLTATWAVTSGTNKVTISVTPAGSLTETTYYILYSIVNHSEQAITIL